MPIGPNGEKRPSNPVAAGVHIARIATGEAEEEYVDQAKAADGRKGAAARAAALDPERRRAIAKKAATARWDSDTMNGATPDTRHPTPDTRHPTPDTRHPTPDTRHPTPDTVSEHAVAGPWRGE